MKEINKKICYACESDNHEIKECNSGKNIFIIDRGSRQINKEELKYRLEEYGKIMEEYGEVKSFKTKISSK